MYSKITIIGTGNVAWHLAQGLEKGGHVINELYGRSLEKVTEIADSLYSAKVTGQLDFANSSSDIFILAVSDGAISSIASEIVLPDHATIVHTSGTVPLAALEFAAADHYGVLYPLQSFTRKVPLKLDEVPFFIEGSDLETENRLRDLAGDISNQVYLADSEKRSFLHLAAVYVSNFTNHLLTLGKELAESNELDFEMLKPLINETIDKALKMGPKDSQTGPAMREDYTTIEKHLELLSEQEEYQKIYRILSQSIIDRKY